MTFTKEELDRMKKDVIKMGFVNIGVDDVDNDPELVKVAIDAVKENPIDWDELAKTIEKERQKVLQE